MYFTSSLIPISFKSFAEMSVLISALLSKLLYLVVIVVQMDIAQSKLGDYTTICSAKDPEFNRCLMKSATEILKNLNKGIPEFNIPPVTDLFLPEANFPEAIRGLNLTLINSTVTGLEGIQCIGASANPKNYTLEFHTYSPNQIISSAYKVSGKFMRLPVKGEGKSNCTMHDVNITWKLTGEPEVRNEILYMKLKDFHLKMEPKDMTLHFDNLFKENKILGEAANKALNKNWRSFYHAMQPKLQEMSTSFLSDIAYKIFSDTPYHEIFKDL